MEFDYFSWDEYFMSIARLSSMRSKDPNTKVGACIINSKNRIIGIGYNGFPELHFNKGNNDKIFPWKKEGNFVETKYSYVIHAEVSAILNSNDNLYGCKMFVTLFPCNECAKIISQVGIKEVVYLDDKYYDSDYCIVSRKIFDAVGIIYSKYSGGYINFERKKNE